MAVPLSRTGWRRSNSLHMSSEIGNVVGWIRQRRYLRGGEEFSRETEGCAIDHLCSCGGYVLFESGADSEENKW